MFSAVCVTAGTPHPFTRRKGTTRDKLCAQVLKQFMNNSKGDAKVLHSALRTGSCGKSAAAEASAPGAWAAHSPRAGSGHPSLVS